MFKNILILTAIYLIGFVVSSNAQEKQCWRGTVEVERKVQDEDIKPKQDASGHGVDIFKYNENVGLKIDFYIEPGKKDLIFGKKISGSCTYELKDKWQSKYATCLKRVDPGKLKREVHVSPGGSYYKEIITTADLYEDNFEFDIDISMDTNPKSKTYEVYSLYFRVSGLKWIGSHTQKRNFKRVDRKTCKTESSEDPPVSIDYEAPIPSSFGGSYKGYADTVNTIIGSKTTKIPTGELSEDNEHTKKLEAVYKDLPYETIYSWKLHRVVCDICKVVELECEDKAAEDLETCELVVCSRCNLMEKLSEIKECIDKCKNDCVKTYGDDLTKCTDTYNTCRKIMD